MNWTLLNAVIQPAEMEWASAMVLVQKKDWTLRFWGNYRVGRSVICPVVPGLVPISAHGLIHQLTGDTTMFRHWTVIGHTGK